MRPIPIHIQKILRFIPLANFIGVFVLIYQCHTMKVGIKLLMKTMFLIIPTVIGFGIMMALLDTIFGADSLFYQIIGYLSFYLYPLFVFQIIIYTQKKFF